MNKKIIIISISTLAIYMAGFGSGMIIDKNYNKKDSAITATNSTNTTNNNISTSSKYAGTWINKDKDELTITQDSKDTFTIKNDCNADVVIGTYKDGIIVGALAGYNFVYKLDEKDVLTVDGFENAGQYTKK